MDDFVVKAAGRRGLVGGVLGAVGLGEVSRRWLGFVMTSTEQPLCQETAQFVTLLTH